MYDTKPHQQPLNTPTYSEAYKAFFTGNGAGNQTASSQAFSSGKTNRQYQTNSKTTTTLLGAVLNNECLEDVILIETPDFPIELAIEQLLHSEFLLGRDSWLAWLTTTWPVKTEAMKNLPPPTIPLLRIFSTLRNLIVGVVALEDSKDAAYDTYCHETKINPEINELLLFAHNITRCLCKDYYDTFASLKHSHPALLSIWQHQVIDWHCKIREHLIHLRYLARDMRASGHNGWN